MQQHNVGLSSAAVSAGSARIGKAPRDPRIDVFRGLALIMIFINHVPGNPYEYLTIRNLGFADAAEAFFLMSGIAAGLAYTPRFIERDRLRHGLWALDSDVDPFSVPPYLTAPFPAYVSFWSALARHDMVEQIPRQIFVASVDRTRRVSTAIGTYSIHHLAPELFDGYRGSEESGYLATPEKALFDTVYIRAPRSARVYFPELSLQENFDERQVEEWIQRIATPRLRTLVSRGLTEALRRASRATH